MKLKLPQALVSGLVSAAWPALALMATPWWA